MIYYMLYYLSITVLAESVYQGRSLVQLDLEVQGSSCVVCWLATKVIMFFCFFWRSV